MNFLYKIAANIYCDLVVSIGLNWAPPQWLFNKPKKSLEHTYSEVIRADINFTVEERWMIEEAIRNLEWFCNGFIQFNITFDWNASWKITDGNSVILKTSPTDPVIVEADGYYQNKILGLCSPNKDSVIIYLVSNRLQNEHTFRTTALHELGHYVGMQHIKYPSIMHQHNFTQVLYMSYKDAVEFGGVFDIDPESLRYFRL